MSNIINCIKENVYNSKGSVINNVLGLIVINNILGLIVNDKEIVMNNVLGFKDGVYREIKDGVYKEGDYREGLDNI